MSLGLADSPLRASSSCRRETDWGVLLGVLFTVIHLCFEDQSSILRCHNLDVLDLILGDVFKREEG